MVTATARGLALFAALASSMAAAHGAPAPAPGHEPLFASAPLEVMLDGKPVVVLFLHWNDPGGDDGVAMTVLHRTGGRVLPQRVKRFFTEGGQVPEIVAVLSRDVDCDGRDELIVQVRWRVEHRGVGVVGHLYHPHVFSHHVPDAGMPVLRHAGELDAVVGRGFDGVSDGEPSQYTLQSAADIAAALPECPPGR